MARIPYQTHVSARNAGEAVTPGAFQATAKAAAGLLSAVDGAAKMVKSQFDKAQEIQNHTDISNKEREIREAKGKFMNEMTGLREDGTMGQATPPAEWGPQWSQRLKTLEGNLALDKVPPVVRRAVEDKFKDFTSSSYIEIAGNAIKANRREAAQNLDRDIADAKARGDFGAIDEMLSEAGNIIPADQISDARRANSFAQSAAAREDEMHNDPAAFIAKMEGKGGNGLHSGVVRRELRAAKGIMSRNLVEDVDIVSELVEAGSIADPADIEAELNKIDNIKPHQVKKLLKGYKMKTPLTREERSDYRARFRKAQTDFLETGDVDAYDDAWMELNEELTSEGKRPGAGDLRGDLYTKTPGNFTDGGKYADQDAKARAAALKPIKDTAATMARSYGQAQAQRMLQKIRKAAVATTTNGEYDPKNEGGSTLSVTDKEFNIALKRDADIKIAEIENKIYPRLEKFIDDFVVKNGQEPQQYELDDYMTYKIIPFLMKEHMSDEALSRNVFSGNAEDDEAYERLQRRK